MKIKVNDLILLKTPHQMYFDRVINVVNKKINKCEIRTLILDLDAFSIDLPTFKANLNDISLYTFGKSSFKLASNIDSNIKMLEAINNYLSNKIFL